MEVMLKLHIYNGFENSILPQTRSKLIMFKNMFCLFFLIFPIDLDEILFFQLGLNLYNLKISQVPSLCKNDYTFAQNGNSQKNKLILIPLIKNFTLVI